MNGPGRQFHPSELVGEAGVAATEAELAEAFAAARVLETHASVNRIGPTDGFEDRVMAAIATEPAPRVVLRSGPLARGGRAGAFIVALGDAWAIATGRGRPIAVRAQALGFLLVAIVAAGSLGTVTAVGVGSLLQPGPTPSSVVAPAATASPDRSSASPSPSDGRPPSIEPRTPSATPEPTETIEPAGAPGATETPEATDDHGGASSTWTPDPTGTAEPADTPKPGETPDASDDHGGGSRGG